MSDIGQLLAFISVCKLSRKRGTYYAISETVARLVRHISTKQLERIFEATGARISIFYGAVLRIVLIDCDIMGSEDVNRSNFLCMQKEISLRKDRFRATFAFCERNILNLSAIAQLLVGDQPLFDDKSKKRRRDDDNAVESVGGDELTISKRRRP
jgi:hypothetical protein